MCNLYSGQSAICDLFSAKHHRAGNLPPLPAIWPYPDNARRSQSMARGRPPVRSRCSGHFRMTYCTSSRKDERAGGVWLQKSLLVRRLNQIIRRHKRQSNRRKANSKAGNYA